MTIFAGIYTTDKVVLRPEFNKVKDEISKNISRDGSKYTTCDRPGFFLATVDFGSSSTAVDESHICVVNGRSYFRSTRDTPLSSSSDIESAIDFCGRGCTSTYLRDCRGTFSLCYYGESKHEVILAADRFGSKPIYVLRDGDSYFFASALRILEGISSLRLKFNLAKTCEKLLFGFYLRDHTPYDDVTCLRGAEVSLIDRTGWLRDRYHKWCQSVPCRDSVSEWEENSYDLFKDAVAIRSSDLQNPLAMLSGGLDSRCIVTVLAEQSKSLQTVTYESKGRRDDKIAQSYAKSLNVSNHLIRKPYTQPKVEALHELSRLMRTGEVPSIASRRIFSGDGGSVGVGFVYVEQNLVDQVAAGDLNGFAQSLFRDRLPKRLFKRSVYEDVKSHIMTSLTEEIRDIDVDDPYRFVQVFFLNTDQRCHLHWFHEDMDLYRMEFEIPFMDSVFTEYLFSIPGKEFMFHQFYHRWIERFAEVFKSVPWQTYPRHLPCPIAFDDSFPDQWSRSRSDRFRKGDVYLKELGFNLLSNKFPARSLNRSFVLQAALLHKFRARSFGNVFEIVNGIMRCRDSCLEVG